MKRPRNGLHSAMTRLATCLSGCGHSKEESNQVPASTPKPVRTMADVLTALRAKKNISPVSA